MPRRRIGADAQPPGQRIADQGAAPRIRAHPECQPATGFARRYTYPLLLTVTGVTLLGVWKSVLDPWGIVLKDTVVLFYPSLIVFAGSLVLFAFRDADRLVVRG